MCSRVSPDSNSITPPPAKLELIRVHATKGCPAQQLTCEHTQRGRELMKVPTVSDLGEPAHWQPIQLQRVAGGRIGLARCLGRSHKAGKSLQ